MPTSNPSLALLALLAGCTGGAVTGEASSSAHPAARSATTRVDNVALLDPPGTYRRWTVAIVEDEVGTACEGIGDPLVTIELYTIFDSAPRGEITLTRTPPPRLFPAAYARMADGLYAEGVVFISAAASTKLVGTLTGQATIDGTNQALDLAFDAPTCAP